MSDTIRLPLSFSLTIDVVRSLLLSRPNVLLQEVLVDRINHSLARTGRFSHDVPTVEVLQLHRSTLRKQQLVTNSPPIAIVDDGVSKNDTFVIVDDGQGLTSEQVSRYLREGVPSEDVDESEIDVAFGDAIIMPDNDNVLRLDLTPKSVAFRPSLLGLLLGLIDNFRGGLRVVTSNSGEKPCMLHIDGRALVEGTVGVELVERDDPMFGGIPMPTGGFTMIILTDVHQPLQQLGTLVEAALAAKSEVEIPEGLQLRLRVNGEIVR